MRIIITGSPGVGKTLIGKRLAEKLGFKFINLNEVLSKTKYVKFNPELNTFDIIDLENYLLKTNESLGNLL